MDSAKHCAGCHNDFYNGNNSHDVKACWNLASAKLVSRLLIHIDQRPPYTNVPETIVPHCYQAPRFVTVDKAKSLTAAGFWKS